MGYTLYHGTPESSAGAYTFGVSLDGGADGYPYRWGFRGSLLTGNKVAVVGSIALYELGDYNITPALLLGNTPVIVGDPVAIVVSQCAPYGRYRPTPAPPIRYQRNGREYQLGPYIYNEHLLVPVRPFAYSLGSNVFFADRRVIITRPGMELILIPGSNRVLLNGAPVFLPVPIVTQRGVVFVPPRYISPFFGYDTSWGPGRVLVID
jgi:hypothetical protein